MAAEVPASDILCEAMEYLSKLGSNLKTRTDSLKEKKIRKDKLKNLHSVHKAANKVLLICELSKKSLENVEKGVRKILSKVETTQMTSSIGGNDILNSDYNRSKVFQQFEYCSRMLRICKTVPIKHYMAVKVVARNMSLSMQDKYPVYYDCKLYRIRRKKLKKSVEQLQIGMETVTPEIHVVTQNEDACAYKEGNTNNLNLISSNENMSKNNTAELAKKGDINLKPLNDTVSSTSFVKVSESLLPELIEKDTFTGNTPEIQNCQSVNEEIVEKEETDLTSTKCTSHKSAKNTNETIVNNVSDESDSTDKQHTDVIKKNRLKKHKVTRILNNSSDDNENVQDNNPKTKLSIEVPTIEKKIMNVNSKLSPKKRKMSMLESDEDNSNKTEQKVIDINEQPTKETNKICKDNEKSIEMTTPQIKCVNIYKLLKPDIAGNLQNKSENSDTLVTHSKDITHKNIKSTNSQMRQTKSIGKLKEKQFLSQKRKDILAFKPKKFFIKVLKLPCISKELLLKYKLKRITQNGSVVCELYDDKLKQSDQAKKKLSNDTDSDDVLPKRPSVEGKKVKYALLCDSDSDNQDNNNKMYSKSDRSKDDQHMDIENQITNNQNDKLPNEDISSSGKQKKVMTKVNEKENNSLEDISIENIKHSLLNESDADISDIEINTSISEDLLNSSKESNINRGDINSKKNNSNINPALLNNENSADNNTCESSNNILDRGVLTLVNKSLKNTDDSMKSHNELQSRDGNKYITDDTKKLKGSLVYDHNHDENNSKTDSHIGHDISKNTEDAEIATNIENHTNSLLQYSDSDKQQPNKLIDDDSNSGETESNSKVLHINLSESKEDSNVNENEPEISPNKIKSSLLNSSDDSHTDDKITKLEPKLRRKRIRESIKARKMLLTHSSSSDEDVPTKDRHRDNTNIDHLISDIVNEIEEITREKKKKKSASNSSGSSDENLLRRVNKKKKHEHSESCETNRQDKNVESSSGSQSVIEDSNQNVDEKCQEHSDSSSCQMVRSKSKPGSSASHNSDTQDDKEVDRLTNLEDLANARRRRGSTDSINTEKTGITTEKNKKMPKGPSLIGEELLKAECSSDSHSEDENVEAIEDLPSVTVPGINNGIGHISKDDLLGDSDSSVSHNDKTAENSHDESDEENVKSKRRKGNTISSDSEAGGGSHKKDRDVKMSDFEDSDDSSEPTKRSKRTKKATDSDASMSSSDANKKKRRRIKQINDSDISDSDGETEGRNKHGRKNIRKVMGKNQLEEATKKAAREEKERIARITERQKLYNNMEFDESGKPDEVVLEKVVLDFDPETKEPLIEVDRGLVKKLKPHQANGIKFMWDACFESVKRIKKDKGSGCILAHCMGLGKTLQVISLTHTLLTHGALTGVSRVLVVCPLSTVLNWVNEFRMWLKHAESDFEVDVYELSKNKQNMERASQLSQWFQDGGVCVLGYEMFRNLSADNNKKFKKKMLKSFQESLVDPGPDLVVCDEGHLLKNEKTSLSQSMNKVKTRRRIVLTGTPLQNNLKEYYCMVQFVKPNLLGKYNEYLNRFVNPITNGQYTDSTEHDIRVMKRRSHVLHKMLDGAVQRRDYGVLAPFLPPKHEYVLFITLSDVQIKLYQTYLDNYSRRPQPGKSSGFLFPDFQSLQRIWTHPLVLKYNSERYEIMQQKKREREEDDSEGSLADFIDDDSTPEETSTEESTDDSSDMSDDSRKKSKKKKSSKKSKGKDKVSTRRGTRANPVSLEQDEEDPVDTDVVEVKYENPTEWWIKMVSDDELEDIRNSHKLVLLFDILRQCEAIGDKLLVFSQSLYSLDLIEHFLGKVDEATQEGRMDEKLGGHFGSWSPGVDYFRLDGSTSCENRSIWCKNFNREDNPRARLFLISTRAGGLGINLVAANRVVIFDVSWNPSHDVQSIFRVYRFGQKKPCYVYRFLAMGTMEEKIYERQVTKQAISKRVIDEQQIDRHYAENDLAELYKFEPKPTEPRELPALPKDRLFAEMLREHEALIYKYHEHDSLLENKEEETLTEEERKAAWEDFENEKNRPPPAPFPTAWPMHNGMMPNLLAQQQQQAYAMLAAMMGKDITKMNENQLGDMLPLLYNSAGMFGGYDYGMMQKMNNYKYAQPGMMNPMMASVMNSAAAAAAGSGLGGTSGLQYEPPWQRQHQQQMRLQQLMQQQNSMGAKYYAGGLGSRDPVAMALQQRRAREIMLGGAGGGAGAAGVGAAGIPSTGGAGVGVGGVLPVSGSRPRGRPPLRSRAATPSGPPDVVNLDSD